MPEYEPMKSYVIKILFSLGFIFTLCPLWSQNPQLAIHYYNRGEYEKAASILEELVDKDPNQSMFFEKLVDCYNQLRDYDRSVTLIQKRIEQEPNDLVNNFLLGNIYELKGDTASAEKAYRSVVRKVKNQPGMANKLAQSFQERGKFEWALETYKQVIDIEGSGANYLFPMASLHYRLGQYEEMIDRYLTALILRPQSSSFILNYFQRYLPEDYLEVLESKVIALLQKSNAEGLNEVLAWTYIQKNDFAMAYRQLRAIDKRQNENGHRLFKLGKEAIQADQFKDADRIFEYIIENKAPTTPFFFSSYQLLLQSKIAQYHRKTLDTPEIEKITQTLSHLTDSLGLNRFSGPLLKDIAEAQAFVLHDYPAAIITLEKIIPIKGLDKELVSEAKILLADIYLSMGDRWEATLLYSQVDKSEKESEIGQKARFRNAKLSYYMGDFAWAQKQFDFLKVATSRLIANDAIDMSVFIIDNMGLDTTDQHLKTYARADFLVFQNLNEQALSVLDSLRHSLDLSHTLQDDILYLEAKIYENTFDYAAALEKYEAIFTLYSDDIWADNALYQWAYLQDYKLDGAFKAMEKYETLFLDYSNSTFAVTARKRYRTLKALFEKGEMPTNEVEEPTIP